MAQAPTVAVVGLRSLVRDVNKLCSNAGELNKELSQAGRRAAEPVAQATIGDLPELTGRLKSSVRVTATRSGAAVRMGRASVPYAGPVEFGGWPRGSESGGGGVVRALIGRLFGSAPAAQGGRQYLPDGRYLFPAAKELAEQAAQLYSEGAQRALDSFNWTNETTNAEAVHD